jgi:hypothetical protein
VRDATLGNGWGPAGFAGGAGKRRRFPGNKTRVSEANLVKGWRPDGFAGGAGKRRRFPGN